jgi:hypothetical protein
MKEYLPTLTKRTKWFGQSVPVKVGDLVFIADGDLRRNQWPRGIVTETFSGPDGKVRVANIKTQDGLFRRPVVKLCVLDVTQNDDKDTADPNDICDDDIKAKVK